MEKLIAIKDAAKRFKKQTVFAHVNMDIYQGKGYGIVGHNGCGKSVLLKTICGFALLSEGEIVCDGKRIGKDVDFLQNAGILIEHPEFIPDLSGYQNLKILAEIQNKIDETRIYKVLKMFDLYDARDKKVGVYSVGMKQKLRLAQAMMEFPAVLILDEPTAGLDEESIGQLYEILNEYKQQGGTLIMTSHNKTDIDTLCDAVYTFRGGSFVPT